MTGTTAAKNSDIELNYPTGKTLDDVIVLEAQVYSAGAWRVCGAGDTNNSYALNIRLTSTKIKVETIGASAANSSLKLVLYVP